jgi:spermidine/putrescine transport system permease protein
MAMVGKRYANWPLRLAAGITYLFLYIPLIVVIIFSFNDSKLNAEWVGFTLKYYVKLFHNEKLLTAAGNSLMIGLVASFFATVFGTLAGIAIHRYKPKFLSFLVLTPIALPELLVGVSLVIFYVIVNQITGWLDLGFLTVLLSHIAFCVGFVAIVVQARMQIIDEALVEAARDLGATAFQAFRLITLPQILPGIIAGGLMAFTLSIDDFVITFFTAGAGVSTLPTEIYSMIKIAVTPEVNAISAIFLLLTLSLIALVKKIAPNLLSVT